MQEGSAKGFASDVKVQLTLDDAGAIAQLSIDASGETAGLGQLTMEDAFTSQFVGKTGPFTLGDGIDSVSGATITSPGCGGRHQQRPVRPRFRWR